MADLDYFLSGAGGGLRGLIDAYKMKLEADRDKEKVQFFKTTPEKDDTLGLARLLETQRHNKEMESLRARPFMDEEPTIEERGGVQYLVRRGREGQKIYQQQRGSTADTTELAGNMASLETAPEFLAALSGLGPEDSVIANLKRKIAQAPVVGTLAGAMSPSIANVQQKGSAFITPYLQSGGGKALTESEKATFKERVRQIALTGDKGTAQRGLADLVREILGKTEAGIATRSAGPATPELQQRFERIREANRQAGLAGDGGGIRLQGDKAKRLEELRRKRDAGLLGAP